MEIDVTSHPYTEHGTATLQKRTAKSRNREKDFWSDSLDAPLYTGLSMKTGTQTDRQTGWQTDRQRDRQTGWQADRQTDRQTGRQTGRQADGHRQAGRQADRQTDRHTSRQRTSSSVHLLLAALCPCTSAVLCCSFRETRARNRVNSHTYTGHIRQSIMIDFLSTLVTCTL